MSALSISDVSDIVSIAGTIVATFAGVWGLLRWHDDKKMAQSEFLEGLINQFADDEILRLICSLDSDEDVYKYFRNPSEPQNRKVIEKSLNLLSYLCYLKENDIISEEAFSLFKGRLRAAIRNCHVQNYLRNELREVSSEKDVHPYLVKFMQDERVTLDYQLSRPEIEEKDDYAKGAPIAEIEFDQPTAIIKISKLYRDGMDEKTEVYNAVKGWWRLRLDVAKNVKLVLAVAHGVVRGVYKVNDWIVSTDPADAGRIGFVGAPAESSEHDKFINRSVRSLFSKGAANPVKYFNIDKR